jgi:hypothetical protein
LYKNRSLKKEIKRSRRRVSQEVSKALSMVADNHPGENNPEASQDAGGEENIDSTDKTGKTGEVDSSTSRSPCFDISC